MPFPDDFFRDVGWFVLNHTDDAPSEEDDRFFEESDDLFDTAEDDF